MIFLLFFRFKPITNLPCWYSTPYLTRRYIFRYHRSGSYNTPSAYCNPTHNDSGSTNPHIILNNSNTIISTLTTPYCFARNRKCMVLAPHKTYTTCHQNIIPKIHIGSYIAVITELHIMSYPYIHILCKARAFHYSYKTLIFHSWITYMKHIPRT